WDLGDIAATAQAGPPPASVAEAEEQAEALLAEAVRCRLLSDVPLGAFLSGGIDSSLVVALMQAQMTSPARTFSIRFSEADYNEADDAAAVARHLGSDHTEFTLTPDDALGVVPALAEIYDEPFADSSQIPTHLVSRLARGSVTVALSGDGGDEIAAGYNRHASIAALWRRISPIPLPMRRGAAALIDALPPGMWERLARALPSSRRPRLPADKAVKLAALLRASTPQQAWRELVTHWPNPGALLRGVREPLLPHDDAAALPDLKDMTALVQYLDMACYLPDDILTKVDRASMAVALEVRCPMIDHRVVEFFWTLPRQMLTRGGKGKLMLRHLLARHVPEALFERPKAGFGVPIEHWLKGPLKEWAGDLLSPERLKREGYFDPAPVQQAWDEHQSGRANHAYRLWTILMFQSWRDHWKLG
ncbi:MAG: asparagine synthetase B, partial [Alphaproteobacteria bacterium]